MSLLSFITWEAVVLYYRKCTTLVPSPGSNYLPHLELLVANMRKMRRYQIYRNGSTPWLEIIESL